MLRRCTVCRANYGTGPKCEACLEREAWAELEGDARSFWAAAGGVLLYLTAVAGVVAWAILRSVTR